MTRFEIVLMALLALASNKLAWELGSKSAKAQARIEFLTEHYLADQQIAEYEKKEQQNGHKTRKRATETP